MGKTGSGPAVNAVEANKASVFERVLKQYASVFEPLSPGLPPEGRVQHHIELQPGARPKSRPPYRLSKFEEEECVRQLKVYLEMGIYSPVSHRTVHLCCLPERRMANSGSVWIIEL